jgi:hypothetical protein
MSNLRATSAANAAATKPRRFKFWLIVYGILGCGAIALAFASQNLFIGTTETPIAPENPPSRPQQAPQKSAETTPPKQQEGKAQPPRENPSLVDDDGKTLWVSPNSGPPLDLAYLSPGAQIIAVLRPAALFKHPEGEKVRAALGPVAQAAIERVEQVTLMPLTDIERLVVGANVTSAGDWLVTFVVHTKSISRDALLAKLPGATEKNHRGKKYWVANERTYYLPSAARGTVLVVAPPDAINDIIELAGSPPPLRRDIERLIDHTDADRHVTIIVAPNSLFSEGQSIFASELSRLREPLFWFLGDELSGAALSMNWGDDFFLELSATPTLETSPEKAANIFAERVAKVPDKLEEYVVNLNAQPYGRHIVSRLPVMVRKLAAYTRSSFERDHAVLRCYLPVVAGHNLLLAAELTLADPGGSTQVASNKSNEGAASKSDDRPKTTAEIHSRLAKITSLRFAKDTLEAALEQLSQDIGIPIVIRGPDLQADGITKNQSFGIDISNKPAEEILVQILRLANPDKEATAPDDKRQKLVYVLELSPDKTEQITITTRAKAAERKTELPAAFRAAKP